MSEVSMIMGEPKDVRVESVAVITARFNSEITLKLEEGALRAFRDFGVSSEKILRVQVPGAVEIPLAAKVALEKGADAVVCLGAVIRGETSHFDYVCSSVERGCTELQLKYSRPVAFGVLTTENAEQARQRAGGSKGNKGYEAVEVALEMWSLIRKLETN